MNKFYLKDKVTAGLVWESVTPPLPSSEVSGVAFDGITFGCYNAENSITLWIPALEAFEPNKYLHLNGVVVLNPEFVPETPVLPSSKDFENAVQEYLNGVAIQMGFDSIYTLVLRAGYPGPWREQAQVMGTWMDSCWIVVRQRLQAVVVGDAAVPTMEELLGLLPAVPEFTS